MYKENYYIITGGPGVGKTSLINELGSRGYNTVSEVAREIIKHQVETNGKALPWSDRKLYSDLMLKHSIGDYLRLAESPEIFFFDRGIPDTYGYEVLLGFQIEKNLDMAVREYKYNRTVFILPPWEDIYHTDTERKQDYEEAVNTYMVMRSVYTQLGYNLIEVPKLPVEERADFVLQTR
ncbi:AAA family ATPase [Dysgonomonas sp. 520]|uniref:AAA family ATPase n=1 Tax=Dysgonomonas sp. 520 TaxID=2302931 RepID=UPI0013D4BADA|nr:AAA family ATPase [Dysgonomonas sp. 520]NDW10882.1 ATPase [Dysgonomonas sp. 520]